MPRQSSHQNGRLLGGLRTHRNLLALGMKTLVKVSVLPACLEPKSVGNYLSLATKPIKPSLVRYARSSSSRVRGTLDRNLYPPGPEELPVQT